MGEEFTHKFIMIEKKNHLSIFERGIDRNIFNNDMNIAGDWRTYKKGEEEIYKKGFDGLLLKCLSFPYNMEVMKQVHEEVCGAHQFGVKMR